MSSVKRAHLSSTVTKNPLDSEGISECFHKISTSLYVSLAPVYALNSVAGIKAQHLDPLIMTYFSAVGGVVLAHLNLRVSGHEEPNGLEESSEPVVAKIMYDSPFAFLWITVDFLVWKPQPTDVLEGWINMQSPSHIGLLIHDTFNATIKRDVIPIDWTFVPNQADEEEEEDLALANSVDRAVAEMEKEESETAKNERKNLFQAPKSLGYWLDGQGKKIEGKIRFSVKSFNVSGRFVSVQGSLIDPSSIPEDLTKQSTNKQHKRFESPSNDAEDESSESTEEGYEAQGLDQAQSSHTNGSTEPSTMTYASSSSDEESDDSD